MDKAIVSSSESSFTKSMKALHATDWVRQGHDHYVAGADRVSILPAEAARWL